MKSLSLTFYFSSPPPCLPFLRTGVTIGRKLPACSPFLPAFFLTALKWKPPSVKNVLWIIRRRLLERPELCREIPFSHILKPCQPSPVPCLIAVSLANRFPHSEAPAPWPQPLWPNTPSLELCCQLSPSPSLLKSSLSPGSFYIFFLNEEKGETTKKMQTIRELCLMLQNGAKLCLDHKRKINLESIDLEELNCS